MLFGMQHSDISAEKSKYINCKKLTEPLPARRTKRASPSLRASMTVEAALVLPIFIFFMAQLLYIFDMVRLQSRFLMALHETGTQMAEYAFYTEYAVSDVLSAVVELGGDDSLSALESELMEMVEEESVISSLTGYGVSLLLSETYVSSSVTKYLGEEYLDNSCLSGGAASVSYLQSQIMVSGDIIDLVADYRISPFLSWFGVDGFSMQSRYYGHAWTGYTIGDVSDGTEDEEDDETQMVYITPTGKVYHLSESCTYLKPSIQYIDASEVDQARNSSGARYYACETCKPVKSGTLVITEDGNRYHSSASCSALKRTIITVPLSEVEGSMQSCSKCGNGE